MDIKTFIFIIYLILIIHSSLSPSQNLTFTLGQNIVVNSNISYPSIFPSAFVQYVGNKNGWTTKNLFVQYLIPPLISQIFIFAVCRPYNGITTNLQFISLDSIFSNQYIYQKYNLNAGIEFQLSLDWSSESNVTSSCGFNILWNGQSQFLKYDGTCTLKSLVCYVISQDGINQLGFQSLGKADSYGILIRNIQLRQLIYQNLTNTINYTELNSTYSVTNSSFVSENITFTNTNNTNENSTATEVLNYIASFLNSPLVYFYKASPLQKAFKGFLGYMIEFNHLILYNFHFRNYTVNAFYILNLINDCEDMKGSIIDQYIYPYLGLNEAKILQGFENKNNFGTIVPSQVTIQNRSNGFLLNITDFVFFQGLLALAFLMIGFGIFKLTFHFEISLLFRQYSFLFGYYICLIFQGQIELYTFYFLSQVLLLFSSNLSQKYLNLCQILFYFIVFVFSVGGSLFFYILYRSKAKFLYEFNFCKSIFTTILFATLNNSIFNIILGVTHRLLIFLPEIQIICLITTQLAMLTIQINLIFKKMLRNKLIAFAFILMGLTRVTFVFSVYLYNLFLGSEFINFNQVHFYYFYLFAGTWMSSLLFLLLQKVCFLYKITKKGIIKCLNRRTLDNLVLQERKVNGKSTEDETTVEKVQKVSKIDDTEKSYKSQKRKIFYLRNKKKTNFSEKRQTIGSNNIQLSQENTIKKVVKSKKRQNLDSKEESLVLRSKSKHKKTILKERSVKFALKV